MAKVTLPTEEQAKLLRSAGVNPDRLVVRVDNGDYICCMRLRTRDEITAHFKKRLWKGDGVGEPKPPTGEQAKLLRSAGIDADRVVIRRIVGDEYDLINRETGCDISIQFTQTLWRYHGRS